MKFSLFVFNQFPRFFVAQSSFPFQHVTLIPKLNFISANSAKINMLNPETKRN